MTIASSDTLHESPLRDVEIPEVSDSGSRLESAAEIVSRRLANTISRRSFLGRLGVGAVAATVGNGASALIFTRSAYAHTNPCQSGCSISCGTLTGSNACPAGTCNCGCWCVRVSTSICQSTLRHFCDCCGGDYCNAPGHGCRCIQGSDGLTHPSCCLHKLWPDGCGVQGEWHIACRTLGCLNSCNRINTVCDPD
jgi:hypothetical protein